MRRVLVARLSAGQRVQTATNRMPHANAFQGASSRIPPWAFWLISACSRHGMGHTIRSAAIEVDRVPLPREGEEKRYKAMLNSHSYH
jgi:hypothetical protein